MLFISVENSSSLSYLAFDRKSDGRKRKRLKFNVILLPKAKQTNKNEADIAKKNQISFRRKHKND